MKLRSAVLLACLAIVPLLAMFSHKIPRDWRLLARRLARGEAVASTAEPPPIPAPNTVAEPLPSTRQPPATFPAATGDADGPISVADRLRGLGAVSVECVPLAGGPLHRCSCRVAADSSGQLQRVFQTSNVDPATGMRNLLGQVQFWKHQLAARTATGDGGSVRTRR